MTRLTLLCGLLITAWSFSGPAIAGAHKTTDGTTGASQRGGGPDGMGMMHPRMAEKLGLSDTQKQELAALMEIYRPRFKELQERGEDARKELLAMAPDDPGYSGLTETVSEEAGRTAAEVVVLMADLQGNIYGLLTPEQQTEFMNMRANMRERMQERRKRMGAGGMHGGHKGKHGKAHADGQACKHGEDAAACPNHPKDGDAQAAQQ